MKYYRLDVYDRQDHDYCFITHPPESIHTLSSYIVSGRAATSKYPDNVVAKMNPDRGGRVLSDFIGNNELSLMVSDDVKKLIQHQCKDTCEYLPVKIENARGRVETLQYFYINPLGTFDVLDKKQSNIIYTDDGDVVKVKRFVLSGDLVEQCPPLFRVPEDKYIYFISQMMVDEIRQQKPGVTNFNIESIVVTEKTKK